MRLATVRCRGSARVVLDDGERLSLLDVADVPAALARNVFQNPTPLLLDELHRDATLEFLPVVPSPSKIICVGHNYRAHILELGHDLPSYPNVFSKFPAALIGAEDPIALSPRSQEWDWEAELALVVGRRTFEADHLEARGAIAGYTVANDVSARDWQRRATQWLLGKTFNDTTPLGPWLVSSADFDPHDPHVISCHVDGVERQHSTTNDLLFSPADLVAYVSQVLPLEPGDVILTGTPGGVGMAMNPPAYLQSGQTVVTAIEGLGHCRNRCVATPEDGK